MKGINAPRPGVHGRHSIPGLFDVTISITQQRFRGRNEFTPQAGSGVLRIAVLGDSFTWGFGANDDETYPFQLQRFLHKRLTGAASPVTQIEVINASNGGGPGEEALWYQIWAKKFSPHIVILTVVANDLGDDLERGMFVLAQDGKVYPRPLEELTKADARLRRIRKAVNSIPFYSFLAQHSQLLSLMRKTVSGLIAHARAGLTAPSSATLDSSDSSDRIASSYKKALLGMAGEVAWLNAQVRSQEARLVIVFAPSVEHVYSQGPSIPNFYDEISIAMIATLPRVCQREGIPFLDLTAMMRDQGSQAHARVYYSGPDNHPTPKGYRAMAEAVADFLAAEGIIGFPDPGRP